MALGNGLMQNRATPSADNYCGGYAKAAILNDKEGTERLNR